MKKIFLTAVFLLTMLFSFNITQAQVFVPKKIDFAKNTVTQSVSVTAPIFNAGDTVDLKVTLDNGALPADKTTIEYGVVRQIINGNTTQYEPISVSTTEKAYASAGFKIVKISIPNTLNADSNSTYVFYAKTQVSDDVDKENFLVSRQNFKIKGNNAEPLVKIKYINILQSNSQRFALLHGPTIYDLSKTVYKGVASSTSLEITFESNTDTTFNPNILFSKLRSDVPVPDFKPESIIIKKGLSYVIIPLPTFNYEAGVYQGVLKLNDKNIPEIKFQYIVAGDAVTFSEPVYSLVNNSQSLAFGIYGAPMDFDLDPVLNNISTSSIEKALSARGRVYNTQFLFRDKDGKELYKTLSDVDFSTTTYVLSIPSNIKNIDKLEINTVDVNGKILYQGIKDLNIPLQPTKDNTFTLLLLTVLLILTIISLFLFEQKYLKVLIVIVAIIILFLGVRIVTAATWGVPDSLISSQSYNGDASYYKQLTINHAGSLIRFNTNIQTEQYDTNQDLSLTYQSSFEACNNNPTQVMTSLALYGNGALKTSAGANNVVSAYQSSGGSNYIQATSYQKHNNTYTSSWVTANLGKPAVGDIVKAFHNVTGAYGVGGGKNASVVYDIPLLNVVNITIITPPIIPPETPPIITPEVPPVVVTPSSVCGINGSVVEDGKTLTASSPNLCSSDASLVDSSFSDPISSSWFWKCKDNNGGGQNTCKASCSSGLVYCPNKKVCTLPSACTGVVDMCPGTDVPGIQAVDDPIYSIAGCNPPTVTSVVKFEKPYADTKSKCYISLKTTASPSGADTTCALDGVATPINSSHLGILVGQHSIVCIAKIVGTDDNKTTLSSLPVTKNFKCSRLSTSGEI